MFLAAPLHTAIRRLLEKKRLGLEVGDAGNRELVQGAVSSDDRKYIECFTITSMYSQKGKAAIRLPLDITIRLAVSSHNTPSLSSSSFSSSPDSIADY